MTRRLGRAATAGLIALATMAHGSAYASMADSRSGAAPAEPPTEAAAPVHTTQVPPAWVREMAPVTHWYRDRTELTGDRTAAGDETSWKDTIGGTVFDTEGVGVGWHEDTLTLLLATHFPNRNVLSAGRMVAPADLALDLDGNGTLETAVVLSDVRATGDRNIVRPGSVARGQVYRVSEWYRPDDLLYTTYGQGWRWTGPDGTEFAQPLVPVWMKQGDLRRDVEASVDWLPRPDDQGWAVKVTLRFLDPDAIPPTFALVWGTAVCGNDVVVVQPSWPDDMLAASAVLPDMAETGGEPLPPGGPAPLPRWNVPFPVAFHPTPVAFGGGFGPGGSGPGGFGPGGFGPGGPGPGGSGPGGFGPGGSGPGGFGPGGSGPGGSGPGGFGPGGPGGPGPGGLGPEPNEKPPVIVVSEPNLLAMFGICGVALVWLRRRRAS
ncbi:MAG: hypothetical protein KDC18_04805 [Alphaproteobacteria bacterium]|nr:hypothetical protein [Alphaproteobacteria bacterium]MCB9929535.1 hypothetical protein [Alphaproteobacteria bacterium]